MTQTSGTSWRPTARPRPTCAVCSREGSALGLACAIPVLAKWVLVGRWRETEIRVWSLAYFRLWTVKSLLRSSPIPFTAGTPLYNVFLRALGADVGRGALIVSRRMPLVTDLLTVGPGAVVRRNVLFNGYHAEAGRIRTGRVTIGAGAHVGEGAVLGLDVTIGDGARLGHASSLQDGEQVPAGERRDGFGGQHPGATDGTDVETRGHRRPCGRRCSRSSSSARRCSSSSRSRPPSPSGCPPSTTHAPECSPDRSEPGRPTPRHSRSARLSYFGYLVVAFLIVVSRAAAAASAARARPHLPAVRRPLLGPAHRRAAEQPAVLPPPGR